jgi:hypothetical protein
MKNTMSTRDKRFVYRSSPPLRRLHLCWGSHKGRAITKSHLPYPINHKVKLMLTKELHKGGVIQTFPGAPHGEGTQQATPNHLEASFKSNKRESINLGRHKCFLRWTNEELAQRAQFHTSNLSHTQTLSESLLGMAWRGVGREGMELKEVFSSWEVAAWRRGLEGV